MNFKNPLFYALGKPKITQKEIQELARKLNTSTKQLKYLNENWILPDDEIIDSIERELKISRVELMLKMGIYDTSLKKFLSENHQKILKNYSSPKKSNNNLKPSFTSEYGNLFQGDCINFLKSIGSNKYDLIFADPPFNLDKFYLSEMNDNLSKLEYINWTENWLSECIRTLKPGGSLFIWNLPKWNTYFSDFLNKRLNFKHWIATDIKFSLPIPGKLYPSHYSLLYYTKGEKANSFHPDRLPMETCPKCYSEIKDYGGYKNKMNPAGINITDVWLDIPPVRHSKHKARKEANELSIKLMDRIIEMSSEKGDLIFDPFGGAGTTYIVSELKGRRWEGIELGPLDDIIQRFDKIKQESELLKKYRSNYNNLFPPKIKSKRTQLGIWTDETFK